MDVQIAVEVFKERLKLDFYNKLDYIIKKIHRKCYNDPETTVLALKDVINGLEELKETINKYETEINERIKKVEGD